MNKENANLGEPMKDNTRKRRSVESDEMVIEEERSETKRREVNHNAIVVGPAVLACRLQ